MYSNQLSPSLGDTIDVGSFVCKSAPRPGSTGYPEARSAGGYGPRAGRGGATRVGSRDQILRRSAKSYSNLAARALQPRLGLRKSRRERAASHNLLSSLFGLRSRDCQHQAGAGSDNQARGEGRGKYPKIDQNGQGDINRAGRVFI